MNELSAAAEPETLRLGAPAAIAPTESRPRSFLVRRRMPLAAAALGASIAIGWLVSGALDRPEPADRKAPRAIAIRQPRAASTLARLSEMPAAAGAEAAVSRVAPDVAPAALFAPHSWHVEPPPPPPLPPAPPPPPSAPAFPYAFLGEYMQGGKTVYFLSRDDRVIDAHVGDHLDASYVFESADASQLVFNYIPLNIRQAVPIAAVKP